MEEMRLALYMRARAIKVPVAVAQVVVERLGQDEPRISHLEAEIHHLRDILRNPGGLSTLETSRPDAGSENSTGG